MKEFWKRLCDFAFPRYCCICHRRLETTEEHLCRNCLMTLPYTHLNGTKNNFVERLLWDNQIDIVRADSLLFYKPQTPFCQIFFRFKYYNHPEMAVYCGKLMAIMMPDPEFFTGIDIIVPVPLSAKRLKQRGYNQSERLAHGISEITGIPVNSSSVVREADNPSQTQLQRSERWNNVEGIFRLTDPQALTGKHILLVDDVITTGSTTRACLHAICQAGQVRMSVMSLATSIRNRKGHFPTAVRP